MPKITAPAQVGNGRAVHYVRTDGFHMKTVGCARVVGQVLTEAAAEKMTRRYGKVCTSCKKAVEAIAAEQAPAVEVEQAPAQAGPRIHRFDDSETAYNASQCSDDIKDGDVLVIASEGIVGVLTNAWPVALTEAHGELHPMADRYRIREMNDGRYEDSADIAEQTAAELGLSLLPQHRAPASVPAEQTAPEPTPELRNLTGMTAPFLIWGRTNRAGDFAPAQTYRQAADAPVLVVETREDNGLRARLADGREVTLYGALLRYWVAPAPVEAAPVADEAEAAEQPAAEVDSIRRQQLVTEVAARTLVLGEHITAHSYQPVAQADGELIAWTFRTGHGASARYRWVSTRGMVSPGAGSEYRWQADDAARLARRTGLDEAPLPEHVTLLIAEPTEALEKVADAFDVDSIRIEDDGPGRWVVVRGADFMGSIHDEGARMSRGRYAAWSPYSERRNGSAGFFHDLDDARDAVARCWPEEAAQIAGELGVPTADVTTAAERLDAEWRNGGRRAIIRAERFTGAEMRVTLAAADELRSRLGVPFHGPEGHTGPRALCSYADHLAPLGEDGKLQVHERTAGQIGACPGSLLTGRAHRGRATRQYTTALSYDVPPKTWLVSGAKPGDQVVIEGETLTVENCQAGDDAPAGRIWLILAGMGLPMTYAVGDRLPFARRVRRQDARCQDCGVYVVVESDTATDGPVKGRLCGVCDGPVPAECERAAR